MEAFLTAHSLKIIWPFVAKTCNIEDHKDYMDPTATCKLAADNLAFYYSNYNSVLLLSTISQKMSGSINYIVWQCLDKDLQNQFSHSHHKRRTELQLSDTACAGCAAVITVISNYLVIHTMDAETFIKKELCN